MTMDDRPDGHPDDHPGIDHAPPPPSRWMVRRENRIRTRNVVWTGVVALLTAASLWNGLWLPVLAVAVGVRLVFVAAVWARVWWARRPTPSGLHGRVPAAAVRATVRRPGAPDATRWEPGSRADSRGDGDLVSGLLEAGPRGWHWRPGFLAAGTRAFGTLTLRPTAIISAVWAPSTDAMMPDAAYLHVRTATGRLLEFVVWDYHRLPPLVPYGRLSQGDALPG